MAACAQIDGMLQGYIDGELKSSDRLLVEQHVGDCATCAMQLRRHQRFNVRMFELHAPYRLARDLAPSIIDHLPDMEHTPIDVAGLNWRAKHPDGLLGRLGEFVPVAAALLLVVLAAVLSYTWPHPAVRSDALGVVTHRQGEYADRLAAATGERSPALLKSFIDAGQRFETGEGTTLMLSVGGPSEIRLNEQTRIVVIDERRIAVEKGQVQLSVGKARRPFEVTTPSGDIRVFGTVFDVRVLADNRTVVTVEDGEVQVEHKEFPSVFRSLLPGQQVDVIPGSAVLNTLQVDVTETMGWARAIVANKDASVLFEEAVLAHSQPSQLTGGGAYFVATQGRPFDSIVLRWKENDALADRCAYNVYVYSGTNKEPLFSGRIPRAALKDPAQHSFVIQNAAAISEYPQIIIVQLVPDFSSGSVETQFEDEFNVVLKPQ